jgi:hypothetical protein
MDLYYRLSYLTCLCKLDLHSLLMLKHLTRCFIHVTGVYKIFAEG